MTDKYSVFGNPIAQSKSPLIHKMFAEQTEQNIDYARKIASVESFVETINHFFSDPAAKGCNVTAPFKEQAAQWVDELSKGAKIAGAVNTVIRQANGQFLGDTTDGAGLVQDLLRLGAQIKDARILLLGAGGAARGVLQSLLHLQPELLLIANRTEAKAQLLSTLLPQENFKSCGFADLADNLEPFDLIINSTSASLTGNLPAVSDGIFDGCQFVYDMSYADKPTVFMQHASKNGAKQTFDGLGMLVSQAAESFYLWRGVRPDVEPVIKGLRAQF